MSADLEDLLRRLRENAEAARDIRIELTDDYLAMIEPLESLPQNQSGADKTDRDPLCRTYRRFFREASALPRKP